MLTRASTAPATLEFGSGRHPFHYGLDQHSVACNPHGVVRPPGLHGPLHNVGKQRRCSLKLIRGVGQAGRLRAAATPTETGTVSFCVRKDVGYGHSVRIVGSDSQLGRWNPAAGLSMTWTEGNAWRTSLPSESDSSSSKLEFKLVVVDSDGRTLEWEPGANHVVDFGSPATVTVNWGEATQVSSSSGGEHVHVSKDNGTGSSNPVDDPISPHLAWAGKAPVFVRSNDFARDRAGGKWETEGLEGACRTIVQGDRDAASWLQKLEVTEKLLVQDAPRRRPGLDAVASAYIYLQWVGSGTLPCVEGGGHFRPNRHAELSRAMFRSLEWVIGEEREKTGRESAISGSADREALVLLARRLAAKLPSFDAAYTASTPLTRIRDIAHRNDIPHELKQEIKHTLQNKLHRNAGPEDLIATKAMLDRITKNPGEYSKGFVSEFKIFYRELSDFFSASSLTDSLLAIKAGLDSNAEHQLVDHFLAAKRRLDSQGPSQDALMDALHSVSTVRALLLSRLASGLRADASDTALAARQRWRQAEMQALDYAFVLLSRFVAGMPEPEALAAAGDGGWALPLGAIVLGLRQVGLSAGPAVARECAVLERELMTWQQVGGLKQRDPALRLKASLQRVRRLTQAFSQLLLDTLGRRASNMGRALGVPDHVGQVFGEAEIRASVVFQLSRLVAGMVKAADIVAGGASPFDVIVAGSARGVLRLVDSLEDGGAIARLLREKPEPSILVVKSASGDEEVAAFGHRLKGIILLHGIPHLSHLGVRARQEKVPFVLVEDPAVFQDQIQPLMGQTVVLDAVPDTSTLRKADEDESSEDDEFVVASDKQVITAIAPASPSETTKKKKKKAHHQEGSTQKIVNLAPNKAVLQLSEATPETSGAKAAGCGHLVRLADASDGLFAAPGGVVLPYGTMAAALKAARKDAAFNTRTSKLDAALSAKQLDNDKIEAICLQIQELIRHADLPDQVLKTIWKELGASVSNVIARSSSNVEDLAGLSGAGLYESVPNLDVSNLSAGIKTVWESLYARRAVISRHAAGLASDSATMAVLIQPQLYPDLSFVLHTRHPLTHDPELMWAEIGAGQGEVLASGTKGAAWRIEIEKSSGQLRMLSFANFSEAWLPSSDRQGLLLGTVDYSTQPLSKFEEARKQTAEGLLRVGKMLEEELGGPQDIEGCICDGRIWVVQTRPQP